jgi:hypothetical protein
MGYSNDTVYTSGGEVGGLGLHKWHCLSCPWTHTTTGGAKGKNAGQRKADSHRCYNSANDSWSERKDLQ